MSVFRTFLILLLFVASASSQIATGASMPNLYVAGQNSNAIHLYDGANGSSLGAFALGSPLSGPQFMTFGPDGDLYVVNNGTNSVLRFNGTTGALVNEFTTSGLLTGATGIAFGPSGNLFVSSLTGPSSGEVRQFNGTTGADLGVFATGNGLDDPIDLVFGPDGNMYVTNAGSPTSNGILRFDGTTGAFIDAFVAPSDVPNGLIQPAGLTFGPDGSLYVSDSLNSGVWRFGFDGMTGDLLGASIFTSGGGLVLPKGLTFGPDDNLYVANFLNNRVTRFDGATGAFIDDFVPAGSAGLNRPFGLLFHVTPVPEPSSIGLAALGAIGLGCLALRRRKR